MNYTLEKLIELNKKLHEILGWKDGKLLEISYDLNKVGDAWLYIDVNDSTMGYNLLDSFTTLYEKALNIVTEIFGSYDYPEDVDFVESESSSSGYVFFMKLLEGEG